MLSAKSTVEIEGRTEGRSFIKTEKRVGPRVEPCGTPLVGKQREEYIVFNARLMTTVREIRLKPGKAVMTDWLVLM